MTDRHDDSADAIASRWYARLRSGEMSQAEHRALADWRLADPAHASAWARVDTLWLAMGAIGDDPAIQAMRAAALPSARVPENRRWMRYAGAAAAATALAAALFVALPDSPWSRRTTHPVALAYAQPRDVVTLQGQRAQLELADGSTMTVAPQSRVRIGPWSAERGVALIRGEAYFQVAHHARRFVVHAGDASVTAVGTAFTVARDDDSVRTVLKQGRIRIIPNVRSGSATLVDAGQAVTIRAGRIVSQVAIDADSETGWTRGELIFAGTPLSVAVARYNRYAARPIRLAGKTVAAVPVTGRFRIGGGSGFVGMMVAAGTVRVVRDDEHGIVLAAP